MSAELTGEIGRYSWHQKNWQLIDTSANLGRLAHAWLLWGASGLGKVQFAEKLAKRLLCKNQTGCDRCQSCSWLAQQAHPDFKFLIADKGKKSITIDQVRMLQSELMMSTMQAGKRVVMLPQANLLNMAASNALLKILEEPSENIHFILCADALQTIPVTIQSRCQSLYFSPASEQQVNAYLEEHHLPTENATLLQGAPLRAEVLLSDDCMNVRQKIIQQFIDLVYKRVSPCIVAESWAQQPSDFLFEVLYALCSDILKIKQCAPIENLCHQSETISLGKLADFMQHFQIFTIIDKLVQFNRHIGAARQINVRLWLDDLAIYIVTG